MNITSANIDICLDEEGLSSPSLNITARSYLSTYSCGVAVKAWKDCFVAHPDVNYVMSFDLSEMSHHESSAKEVWKKALEATHGQIKEIVIFTDSIVARWYIRFMLRSLHIPIQFYASPAQFHASNARPTHNAGIQTKLDWAPH